MFINSERFSPEGLQSEPYELKSEYVIVCPPSIPNASDLNPPPTKEPFIDIAVKDNKAIHNLHHKFAPSIVYLSSEQDARAEQHQQHDNTSSNNTPTTPTNNPPPFPPLCPGPESARFYTITRLNADTNPACRHAIFPRKPHRQSARIIEHNDIEPEIGLLRERVEKMASTKVVRMDRIVRKKGKKILLAHPLGLKMKFKGYSYHRFTRIGEGRRG
jgi:hypothetical protein